MVLRYVTVLFLDIPCLMTIHCVVWWHSGYGVGLVIGDRGFNPSRGTVVCGLRQETHIDSVTKQYNLVLQRKV